MKLTFKILSLILILFAVACGEKKEKEQPTLTDTETIKETTPSTPEVSDLENKGIGPVKSLQLDAEINAEMATRGAELFKNMCSACHKMDKKFIGPELSGVTERRTPEWIMNMILNPENMIKEDPIAKKLLVESNMAVMANQGLSEEEARAILEYFRQFDQEN